MSFTNWLQSGDWARAEQAVIPMLPANVRELVQLALDPEVTARRMARAIGQDPVTAAQVIRMANTAGSAPGVEVTSINDAVMRLGTQAARNIVIAGCLSGQLADPKIYGRQGRAIVDHCLGTAALASELADDEPGELFLCGLLHDIGKLLVLKLAHEYGLTHERPSDEEIEAVMAARHAQLGGWLAGRWQIPASLADPIIWHHDVEWAYDRDQVAIVYAANRLAHRYGFGCNADTSDLLSDPIICELGLNEARLASLDATAPLMFRTLRSAIVG